MTSDDIDRWLFHLGPDEPGPMPDRVVAAILTAMATSRSGNSVPEAEVERVVDHFQAAFFLLDLLRLVLMGEIDVRQDEGEAEPTFGKVVDPELQGQIRHWSMKILSEWPCRPGTGG